MANGYRFEMEVETTTNLRHGSYRVYRDDFCYTESEYIQGNPMTSVERHPNGFVMSETTYSSIGEVSYGSKKFWLPDGRLSCIASLKHGSCHGPTFHYEQDGKIKLQEYSHGIGDKTLIIWHDNGQISFMKTRSLTKDIHNFVGYHRNGIKSMQSTQGPPGYAARYTRWDEAGTLIRRQTLQQLTRILLFYSKTNNMNLLDKSSLFELLIRLDYTELQSLLRAYPKKLYRITNGDHFNNAWNKYNLRTFGWINETGDKVVTEYDRHDLKHGVETVYIDHVKFSTTQYSQDKQHGLTRHWYANGTLYSCVTFVDGQRNGSAYGYQRDGSLDWVRSYKNNLLDGLCKTYNSDTQNTTWTGYKSNKAHGKSYWFYDNGQLYCEFTYVDGVRHGVLNNGPQKVS